jgi:tetratricopeptide (TPR) repeat protein
MFCKNCGKEVPADSKFCLECGKDMPIGKVKKKYDMVDMKIAMYEKEISINPRDVDSYFILGKEYGMVKNYEKAVLIYEEIRNNIPSNGRHHGWLSRGTLRGKENGCGGIMHVSENCGTEVPEFFKEFTVCSPQQGT